MGILLAFAPFIAFALVDRLIGATEGLIAGAAVSAALLLRDCVDTSVDTETQYLIRGHNTYGSIRHYGDILLNRKCPTLPQRGG
jgi:hypothetical protein